MRRLVLREWVMAFWFCLKSLPRRRQLEHDLDDELEFHLAMQQQQLIDQGMPPEEARCAARRAFGNPTQTKETARDLWSFPFLETLAQDLRYGLRQLRRNPGFTAVAVLTLALGIGANTAIFSLVDAMLLKPLAVAHPDQLFGIYTKTPQGFKGISYPDYMDLKQQASAFSGFLVCDRGAEFLNSMDRSSLILVDRISPDYFTTLGVLPFRGRVFSPHLDIDSGAESAVISYRLWKDRLGADPNIIGKTIKLTGRNTVVLGIAPPGFHGLARFVPTDAWELATRFLRGQPRGDRYFVSMARLKKGVTIAHAQTELDAIGHRLAQAYPATNKATTFIPIQENRTLLQELLVSSIALAFPALVLLIACANVAGLLLARGEARGHELAVRITLGAGRFRLARQLFTEGALLSIAGAGLGLLLTGWLIHAEPALMPPAPVPIGPIVRIGGRLLFFTLLATLVATVVFSLAPALQGLNTEPFRILKGEGRSHKRGRRVSLRTILVMGQIALSVVMLTGAMLLFRSLQYTLRLPVGFNIHKNLLVVSLLPTGLSHPQAATFMPGIVEKVRGLPGVEHATCARRILLSGSGGGLNAPVSIPGVVLPQRQSSIPIKFNSVGPEYFATVGTRILAGRAFTSGDGPDSQKVAIVSQMMAKRFWRNGDAIGHSIDIAGIDYQVVGIAEDAKINNVHEPYEPYMYLPFTQSPVTEASLILETVGNPDALIGAVKAEIHNINPAITIFGIETSKQLLSEATWEEGIFTRISGALSLLGIFLATIGLYGVISYVVKRRTHEIGVRMALGARPKDVLLETIRYALRLAVIGTAIGVIAAFAAMRLMASALYGVSPHDPRSFLYAVIAVITVSLLAGYIPARRAAKVDPMVALRYE